MKKQVMIFLVLSIALCSVIAEASSMVVGTVFAKGNRHTGAIVAATCNQHRENAVSSSSGGYKIYFDETACPVNSDVTVKASYGNFMGIGNGQIEDLGVLKISMIDVLMSSQSSSSSSGRNTVSHSGLKFSSVYIIEEYADGSPISVVVTIRNEGHRKVKDITVTAGFPEIGLSSATIKEIRPKDKATITLLIDTPTEAGIYDLAINAENEDMQIKQYREIRLS